MKKLLVIIALLILSCGVEEPIECECELVTYVNNIVIASQPWGEDCQEREYSFYILSYFDHVNNTRVQLDIKKTIECE